MSISLHSSHLLDGLAINVVFVITAEVFTFSHFCWDHANFASFILFKQVVVSCCMPFLICFAQCERSSLSLH
jgi:hypothetical protein